MGEGRCGPSLRDGVLHGLATLLVVGFANAFALWRLVGDLLGAGIRDAGPFIAIAAASLVLILVWRGLRAGHPGWEPSWSWLAAGAVSAAAGLAIADPDHPAKRIHVPEYILLAVVVRAALGARAGGAAAAVMAFLVSGLYGVHDEVLQGFHPARSYGVRDILVNLLGAGAGVCLLRAVVPDRFFGAEAVTSVTFVTSSASFALAAAGLGAALAAVAFTAFRHDVIPLWTTVPALAAGVIAALLAERGPALPGLRVVAAQLFVLALYPVLTHVAPLDFS